MQTINMNIEGPYGNLLNKMVAEMASKDYTLKSIETYVIQMENFLSTISSSNMDISDVRLYLSRTLSASTVEALHFFFREVLASTAQGPVNQVTKPASHSLSLQEDSLYEVLTV